MGFPGKEFSLQMHLTVFTFISSNNVRLLQKTGFEVCLLKLGFIITTVSFFMFAYLLLVSNLEPKCDVGVSNNE